MRSLAASVSCACKVRVTIAASGQGMCDTVRRVADFWFQAHYIGSWIRFPLWFWTYVRLVVCVWLHTVRWTGLPRKGTVRFPTIVWNLSNPKSLTWRQDEECVICRPLGRQLIFVRTRKRILKDNVQLYVKRIVARNLVLEPAAFPFSLIDTIGSWQHYLASGGHV